MTLINPDCLYFYNNVYFFLRQTLFFHRYESFNVNVADKPQWFLDKNPLGKVPTIQVSKPYFTTKSNTVSDNECHTPRLIVFHFVHSNHLPIESMTQMIYHLKALT